MMNSINWSKKVLFALFICVVTVAVAVASELTKPKADGLIGEQANGYVGLVTENVPADIRRLVDEVNARRKAGYQRIADREGTALSEVEKVGGKTAYEKTLKGNYFRDASGTWRKK